MRRSLLDILTTSVPVQFSVGLVFVVLICVAISEIANSARLEPPKGIRVPLDLSLYIVNPISKQKILPDTPPSSFPLVGSSTDNTIRVSACRGEFEPASFVIRPDKDMTEISIAATDLQGPGGRIISKEAIDVRLVKCWYQADGRGGISFVKTNPGTTLVPELLLKDDNLVRVDYVGMKNYLRVKINGQDTYIDISSPDAVFPNNAEIHDAKTLLPFDVQANTNKQVWLTFRIPDDAVSGEYKGTISLRSGSQIINIINIKLTVLPFDLQNPIVEYSLYYRGQLRKGTVVGINSEYKSQSQYTIELQNMKDHGVMYPTLYQLFDEMLGPALAIRTDLGLPIDKLYALGIGTQATPDGAILSANIGKWMALLSRYGYGQLYIYGKDEASGEALLTQRALWKTAHNSGARVFAACYAGAADTVGDLLDLPNLSGPYQPKEVQKWHKLGKRVFIYGNPQVGREDAEIYRRNYGVMMVCSGYDGTMDYAYQHGFGRSIWNDFDDPSAPVSYKDHVFAYPTSDGVIDTIQWEGWREAVDDVRYLTTLAKATDASAYASICGTVSKDSDLSSLRATIIGRIIARSAAQKQ